MANHGGARKGAGAPKKDDIAKIRSFRMTDADWKKFKELGGVKWLRDVLSKQCILP